MTAGRATANFLPCQGTVPVHPTEDVREASEEGEVKRLIGLIVLAVTGTLLLASSAGAAEDVRIVRDSHGEPHISAPTAAGAMYGFAWAQMEDQADYILRNLYAATGRSAEVLGSDCKPNLTKCFEADQLTRLFRIPDVAKSRFGELSEDDRSRFEAFAAGINAYVAEHPDQVPVWARNKQITGPDVVASVQWSFVMAQLNRAKSAFKFNTGPAPELRKANLRQSASKATEAGAETERNFLSVLDDPAYRIEMNASNMFAVDGTKTASGKPILNSDPHLAYEGSTQWYQARVSYGSGPDRVSVAGSTFRGLPAIGIGNNGYVAWGHTSNQGAIHEQDAYKEKLVTGEPNSYEYGGDTRQMVTETVEIKALTDGGVVTVPVRFRYTIHGPVVTDPLAQLDGTQPLPGVNFAGSLTASQYEQIGLASEMWREAEARNLDQFQQAMSNVQLSQFNTLAADKDDILFVATSRSGRLNPGVPVNQLLDGSEPNNTWVSSDADRPWTGVLTLDELMPVRNPSASPECQVEDPPATCHYYENANNTPWTSAPHQIKMSDFPYYMQLGNDGNRSRQLRNLLNPASNLTLEDVDKIAFNDQIEFAPVLIDLLHQSAPSANPKIQQASALLDSWVDQGYEAGPNSTQFVLFVAFIRAIDPAKLGNSDSVQKNVNPAQASAPYPDGLVGQPNGYTTAQLTEAAKAAGAAATAVQSAFGNRMDVRTGDVHVIESGSYTGEIGGGTQDAPAIWMTGCKNAYPATQLVAFPCSAANGSSYMMDVDFGSGRMHTSKPIAGTDNPDSPFYAMNAEDFANERFRNFPLTESDLEAEKTSEQTVKFTPETNVCEPPFTGEWPDCVEPQPPACEPPLTGEWPDCVEPQPPACEPPLTGEWPDCLEPSSPKANITAIRLTPKKRAVRAGKSVGLKIRVVNKGDRGKWVTVKLKVNRKKGIKLPSVRKIWAKPGVSAAKKVTFRTRHRAKGKYRITASAAGKKTAAVIKVKPVKRHRKHRGR
jgi:acyl-homoserine-lactone acylase